MLNVTTRHSDGNDGWPQVAPFDRIIGCAAVPEIPAALADQLAPGGILVAPVGVRPEDQRLVRVTRQATGFATEQFGRAYFVPMRSGSGDAGEELFDPEMEAG